MKFFSRLHAIFLILALLSSSVFAQNKDWLIKMQDPNVNFWELQNEFNNYWNNRTDFKGNGYKVFKRWQYINEVRVLSNGKLLAPDYVMKEYERYMAEAPILKSASGTWNIIGPTTYPSNNTGQPTGKGRINAIAFHPSDVNTIYIGAPSGGIWKSTNGGANWSSLSANIPYLGVSAILIHPSDPNTIYIGTGDRDSDDAPGVGVYKSTDGGATWEPANAGMGNTTIGMMVMHPSDPNTIIAASYDGIFKTTNGGTSWTLTQAGDFRDIKFKPGDPTVMYATRMVTPSEFYRSTNGGSNWTLITTPTSGVGSRMVIGVSPANASYVYLVQIKAADATFKALLRSTDSGQTFSEQSSTPNIFDYACNGSGTASQATYDLCIEVDQTDEDIVYVGSINSWKSTNGGVNWSPVSHWVGSGFAPGDPTANCAASVHADHHWYQWSPHHSPARLYLGHDGGIVYTANGGSTWTDITTDLPIGQVYKVGQATQTAGLILAGFQDNGVSATSNGASFTTIGGGDGFECIVDYSNSNFCYQTSQNGNMRRSTTGVFGSYSSTFNGLVTDNAAFSTPYMLHRTNPNTMFMGRENVWRSTNIKATPASSVTWAAISSFAAGLTIRVVEQSPANLDILYISRGTGSGSVVYRSDNANAAANSVVWNVITKPGGYTVTGIKAHPTDPNTVYATANMQVFKSTDKGVTWTDITGNLPALFTNCLAIDEDANEGIYVGNQTGVWYKDATISEWILFSSGMPPVDVRELEIYYDANPDNSRITAATYGRGVWQSDLAEINVVNPSNLAAATVSSSQIDLSWTLNASSDNVLIATSPTTIFGVPADGTAYTAGNSLPGGGTVVYVGNLTNFNHTGLNPNATYCYKIWSVNGSNQYSAGLTPVCTSTYSDWTGNVNTDWFNTGNWGSGAVPTAADGAYIPAGRPNYPLINATGATCYHLFIASGASVGMDASTSYTLQVTGDWENNGTFNRGVGTVEFNGTNELQTIKGTSTSDFYILGVDKGSTNNILDAVSPITLNAAVDAPLALVSGTFRLSNAASNITAITANGQTAVNALGSDKRIWVSAGTLNINSRWRINAGALQITGGTVNAGNANNMEIDYLNNGAIILQGGALNVSAGIWGNATSSTGSIQISGGTITVGQFFNGFSKPMFEATSNCAFTMSGGTIILRRSGSHTENYLNLSSNASVTGGTLQIGNATTPASQTVRINSSVPVYNLTINATNSPTVQLVTNNLTVKNDLTISGGTLNANNLNMTVGGHWSNSGTYTPGAGTVTFNGAANQNLTGSNATTFNHLTLNNANGLTLSSSVNTTLNGALTLTSGVIATGSNRVIISATGSVTRTSGHIFGYLQKNVATGSNISRTFEIGDAVAANYTPVSFTFASVSVAGNLTARAVAGDHPQIGSATLNASKSVNRYWSLTNAGTTFTACDAVFNFLTADLDPSVNTSSLIGGKYDAPNWTYPATGTQTANSTEITGVTSFSDFQLAEALCINPDVPTLAVTVNPTCSGQPTDLSISSGNLNGAANWQWYSGSCGGTPVGTGANLTVSPTTTTTYYARGEGGCVVTPGACGNITLTVNPLPTAAISGNLSYCAGGNTTLTASGGVSYEWSNGDLTAATTVTAGAYTVTVTDANGCEDTESATVTENPLPTVTLNDPADVCETGADMNFTGTPTDANGVFTTTAGAGFTDNGDGTAVLDVSATGLGTYDVTYIYTDGNGCFASQTVSVTVTACAINFSGRIIWEGDYLTTMTGVNDADVTLSGDDSDSDVSDVTGNYSLDAMTGSNFEIKPVKNKPTPSAMNGLTAADASRTQQHLIGAFPFASPYKLIAADINKTNSVTAQDANLISQALLGNPIAQDMFINTTWRFVPKAYIFPVPAAPWGFPEKIVLTGVSGSMSDQDFIGAKLGDVNNTANPANLIPGTLPHLIWKVQDRALELDAEFVAEFNAHDFDALLALQFALSFDAAKIQLLDVETIPGSPMGMADFGTYNLADGEIRALLALAQPVSVPNGTPVFRLKFKVLQGGDNLSDVIHLSHDVLAGEVYKSDFTPGPVSLVFSGTTTGSNSPDVSELVLLQNRPNPFSGATTIGFMLPESCVAQLRIFDVSGKMLAEKKAQYAAGRHEEVFNLEGVSGVLYYELTTPFGVMAKRMVATR